MSLAPLLSAPVAIQVHAFIALAAFALGAFQLTAPKGTTHHRVTGWAWVIMMAVIAASSFWIHELNMWGPWSPIHLLSILTLVSLPIGVALARTHRVKAHRMAMVMLFAGALLVAGIFTLVPGRIMHAVVTGG